MNKNFGQAGRWLIGHRRKGVPLHRLICFPYAGGNAKVFNRWSEYLPETVEIIAIEAPGKGSRLLEKPCTSLAALCDTLLQEITPLANQIPFSFFGHSNGALIAFELACRMQHYGLRLPSQMLLSASAAPWTRINDGTYSKLTDDEFKKTLRTLNGTPPEILEDDGLFELLLPGLRADFSLSEGYCYRWIRKLPVATHIFYGEFDEIDEDNIFAWQDKISSPIGFEKIPGGHFFIHSHIERLTNSVGSLLQKVDSRLSLNAIPVTS